MKKRTLGNSPLEVSEISLGCMSLPLTIDEARPIIEAALEVGMNYFDTADLYDKGMNEEIVGTVLQPVRQDIILATKVGNRWEEGTDRWTWDPSPAHIKNGLKDSLRRLKTDYIDVYQLHGGTMDDPWEEIIETFEALKKEGLIREYGISSIRPNVFVPFLQNSHAVSNMMQFSLLDRRPEEWFETIHNAGASVVTRGSIAKGLLTAEWRQRLTPYMDFHEQQLQQVLEQLEYEYNNIHALAFAFNLHFSTIASTVIGARTKEQLLQSVAAYKEAQTMDDLSKAMAIVKQHFYTDHR
ncbi:aldo/keto reductase [Lysinibacillus sp. KU-BSD001]|uniref:aldo/keto reductase n=1 Tax=Lysinibacillus sp. KU-BSD001 TaxID=3141328 RepID=UPI0036EBEB50